MSPHQLGLMMGDGDARIDVGRKRIRPATREGRVRCEVEITATIIANSWPPSASSSSTSILAGSQTSISIGTFAVSRSAQKRIRVHDEEGRVTEQRQCTLARRHAGFQKRVTFSEIVTDGRDRAATCASILSASQWTLTMASVMPASARRSSAVIEHRLAADRDQRLGQGQGDRAHALAKACCKNHGAGRPAASCRIGHMARCVPVEASSTGLSRSG